MKKKIPYFELLPIIVITILLYKVITEIEHVGSFIYYILKMLKSLFWGIGIAFVINPIMKLIEKKLKSKRVISITISYIVFFGVLIAITTVILPKMAKNIAELLKNIDIYQRGLMNYYENTILKEKWFISLGLDKYLSVQKITDYILNIPDAINSSIEGIILFVKKLFGGIFTFIVGVMFSLYILADKERFKNEIKRISYALFNEKNAKSFLNFLIDVNNIFKKYILGKTMDSAIIGFMCFVGLLVLNAPYKTLIAIIVGVTNMVPYLGPL